ncbi:MAG: BF3164 family lipoprotein [Breznakibacter sp.]
MKFYGIGHLIAITFALFSCNMSKKDEFFLDTCPQKQLIVFEKEYLLNDILDPKCIHLLNGVLIIESRGSDNNLISVIDTSNFNEIARFCKQGKGPNEVGVMGFVCKINEDSVVVSDFSDFENYVFSIQNVLNGSSEPSSVFKAKNKHGATLGLDFIGLNSSKKIVATGIHAEGRYALYDENGSLQNYYIDYPQLENIESENELLQAMTFQAALSQLKDNRYFASLSRGVIDIVEYSEEKGISLVARKEYYKDQLKLFGDINRSGVAYPTVSTSSESIVGFEGYHFQSSDEYIYCLFSPKKFSHFKARHSKPFFNDLVTLDWRGEPQTHYHFERDVFGFAVTNDNRTVFFLAYNRDGEPVILKSRIA